MDNLIVLTTRNEGSTIGQTVERLAAWAGRDVLVVDAGSEDNTVQEAARMGGNVLVLPGCSIAAGLMAGWEQAVNAGYRYLVQLDAGGSHDPDAAHDLLTVLDDTGADIVIGSRFCRGGVYVGRPWRAGLSRLAALACNARTNARLTDWTSGYRAFCVDALRRLLDMPYGAQMHGWQIEVLGHALYSGMLVVETPIVYRAGRSSFSSSIAKEALAAWVRL